MIGTLTSRHSVNVTFGDQVQCCLILAIFIYRGHFVATKHNWSHVLHREEHITFPYGQIYTIWFEAVTC